MRAIRQATGLRAEYTGPFGGDQAAPLAEVGTDGGGGNVQGKGGRGDWVNSGVNLDKTHRAYWRQEVADFLLAERTDSLAAPAQAPPSAEDAS